MKKVITLEIDTDTADVQVRGAEPRATFAPSGDPTAPYGRDPFGTPYESVGERTRMENLMRYSAGEAGNYTGVIDPDTLGLYDWAFYVQSGLWKSGAKDYAIFTKKAIVRDPDTGRVLMNPEAELAAVDVSGYDGPLKEFA